eukprot:gene1130-2190_t
MLTRSEWIAMLVGDYYPMKRLVMLTVREIITTVKQCYAIAMERMMMSQQGVGGVGVGGGPMGMAMGGGVGGGGGGGGGPMGGMGMSHPMMAMPGAMPYYNAGPGMMPGHGMGMGMGMGLPMRQGMGAAAVGRGDWGGQGQGQGQGQGYRRDQQGARR